MATELGGAREDPAALLLGSRDAARRRFERHALRAIACAALAALIALDVRAQDSSDSSVDELLAQPAGQSGTQRPPEGWSAATVLELAELWIGFDEPNARAASLHRCCDALAKLKADTYVLAYVTLKANEADSEAGRIDEACDEMRRGIEAFPAEDLSVVTMQIDLADYLQHEGCWREARKELARALPKLTLPEQTPKARASRLESAGLWSGVQGVIDLKLGLPERAALRFADEVARAKEAWEILGNDSKLRWAALDHRLAFALATGDFAGVDAELARIASDPFYADLEADLIAHFDVLAGAARYELERLAQAPAKDAKATLQSVLDEPSATSNDRLGARILLTKYAVEHADWPGARELLDEVRKVYSRSRTPRCGGDPVAVELDALEARVQLEASTNLDEHKAALEDLERSFETFLRAWSEAPDREGGIGFLRYGERYLVIEQLTSLSLAVHGPELGAKRALQALCNAELLGSLAEAWKLERKPIDEWLSPLVRDGQGVILFVPGRTHSSLFVADGSGVAVHEIDADCKVRQRIGLLNNAAARAVHASDERAAPPDAEARALGESLLPEAVRARIATWKSAWLIGDETFGHLALELVPLGDGRRLGDVLPLVYAPSIPVAAELAARAASRGVRDAASVTAGVVGAPTISGASVERWKPTALDIDESTWTRWSETWSGRWKAWLGPDATAKSLCTAGQNGVDVLQVVAHGIEDFERDASLGLLLAGDDGELWSDQLTGATPRLVLLAACEIGAHPIRVGDDGRGTWAGRLASAGTDCVVLTPVDLEVRRALDFFERVQRAIRRGDSPAEALVLARRELASGGARAQDYLIYAWGAGSQPIVARSSDLAVGKKTASESVAADGSLWKIGAASLVGLAALAIIWRIRSAAHVRDVA